MQQHLQPREWKLKTETGASAETLERLERETGLKRLTLRVCLQRGLESEQAIREFLFPKFELLTHPARIQDMDRAVDRLVRAREGRERIRVYGDYDVDGTTGAALFGWVLKDFGFEFDIRQPDRFKDGYGLNVKAVEEAHASGARVLLTVDCGITSFDAAAKAQELAIDLIVVDHHQLDPKRGLPPAVAVVNPQRPDCDSGLKQLCGCGLAFYVAMALRAKGRELGWFPSGAEPNLKQHLDLVVMATAADMVPLTGDNHILVRHGLEVLKRSKKPGVKALLEAAGLGSSEISPGHLGFVIGPRINASGRIQSASLALELLSTEDASRAAELARELEKLNQERQNLQNQIWDEVRERVEKGISEGRYRHGIVVGDARWHEGVVGIVASRVTELYRRPAAVIALREDFGKGSVRSYGGKDVLAALRASAEKLLGFGGHKHAAGLSVSHEQLEAFADSFDHALSTIEDDITARPLYTEGECELSELEAATIEELERLGPFGPGNPEPVFSLRARVANHRILKERHLKMTLVAEAGAALRDSVSRFASGSGAFSGGFASRPTIEAIWFHAAERPDVMSMLDNPQDSEWAGVPELNRFRGNVTPTFRVKDWRPS